MTEFSSVLKTSDLAEGQMKTVDIGGIEIVIANVGGTFCAFGNICPHEEAPLVDGEIDGDAVVCPWHFTRFDMRTGEALDGVTDQPIPVYEVRVENDEVHVANPGKAT